MKPMKSLLSIALALGIGASAAVLAEESAYTKIAADLESVEVNHNGEKMSIRRSADKEGHLPEAYAKTSRHCPPFCVQPMQAAEGVDTVGELELLDSLRKIGAGDQTLLVVDSRTPEWLARGTIPGAVNIPWNKINLETSGTFESEAEADTLDDILVNHFGVTKVDGQWDFRNAKTLVLFCNGIWCGQSLSNIRTLVKLGYPAYKLKWYRGGMQDWVSVGLTTASH
jgi:rhodanese-related sulfurtransferase